MSVPGRPAALINFILSSIRRFDADDSWYPRFLIGAVLTGPILLEYRQSIMPFYIENTKDNSFQYTIMNDIAGDYNSHNISTTDNRRNCDNTSTYVLPHDYDSPQRYSGIGETFDNVVDSGVVANECPALDTKGDAGNARLLQGDPVRPSVATRKLSNVSMHQDQEHSAIQDNTPENFIPHPNFQESPEPRRPAQSYMDTRTGFPDRRTSLIPFNSLEELGGNQFHPEELHAEHLATDRIPATQEDIPLQSKPHQMGICTKIMRMFSFRLHLKYQCTKCSLVTRYRQSVNSLGNNMK